MADCLCDECAALCCRYFALPIDNPKTARQFDDIRWYLCHENVVVFIEKKQWYVGFMSRCKHLQLDNRCGIYETRPKICREYSTENCDYHGGEYDFAKLFTSAEQLRQYALEYLQRRRVKRKKQKAETKQRKPARSRPPVQVKSRPTLRLIRRKGIGTPEPLPVLAGTNGNGSGAAKVRLPVLRG